MEKESGIHNLTRSYAGIFFKQKARWVPGGVADWPEKSRCAEGTTTVLGGVPNLRDP